MTCTSRFAPTWRTWSARLAAISSVSRSVTRTTRSCGVIRRQVRTAFRAPGASSSAYTDGSSVRFRIEIEPFLRRSGAVGPVFQVEAVARLVADAIHDLLQVSSRLVENAQLAVRSRAVLQDPVYPLDLLREPSSSTTSSTNSSISLARSRKGTSISLPQSINFPSIPQRLARHLFSRIKARR